MSIPVKVAEIICIEDDLPALHEGEQQTIGILPSPQSQRAPSTLPVHEPTHDDNITEPSVSLPQDLDVIKKFIQHDNKHDFIPLMSAITIKKKRKMLFLPLEINKVKIEALVDSGA